VIIWRELGLQGEFNTEDAEDTEHPQEKAEKSTGLKPGHYKRGHFPNKHRRKHKNQD